MVGVIELSGREKKRAGTLVLSRIPNIDTQTHPKRERPDRSFFHEIQGGQRKIMVTAMAMVMTMV